MRFPLGRCYGSFGAISSAAFEDRSQAAAVSSELEVRFPIITTDDDSLTAIAKVQLFLAPSCASTLVASYLPTLVCVILSPSRFRSLTPALVRMPTWSPPLPLTAQ